MIQLKSEPASISTASTTRIEAAAARRFIGRFGNPFTAVGTDADGRGAIEWGVYGTPETFVVNGKGEVVYKHVGPITAESLTTKLLPAIEKARGLAVTP